MESALLLLALVGLIVWLSIRPEEEKPERKNHCVVCVMAGHVYVIEYKASEQWRMIEALRRMTEEGVKK